MTERYSTALMEVDPVIREARPYFRFRSPAMREALKDLPRIAESDHTVLISGETGTGKEIVSRAIHLLSRRRTGPFIAVNCSAIPEGLIESELFGHEKGAFTGALKAKLGKFELANRGTLFLDEIGDMPLHLQVKLLRELEERRIYRVGGESPINMDVRVIAATRVPLEEAVKKGLFREDLFYRINVLRLHLPKLSERVEDISLLSVLFIERALGEIGYPHPYPTLSTASISLLEKLPWQGNVRELRNVMTRVATFLSPGVGQILPSHIAPYITTELKTGNMAGCSEGMIIPHGMSLTEAEDMIIRAALERNGGNRTRTAQELGIGIRTLRRKINIK